MAVGELLEKTVLLLVCHFSKELEVDDHPQTFLHLFHVVVLTPLL